MRTHVFAGLGLLAVVLLVGTPAPAAAQSASGQSPSSKGDFEKFADEVQVFIVKWFPLVFVVAAVVLCVVLSGISSALDTMTRKHADLDGTLGRLVDKVAGIEGNLTLALQLLKGPTVTAPLTTLATAMSDIQKQLAELTKAIREKDAS